jgi:TolA-binding protein
MNPKLIFVLAIYSIFAGCYTTATQEQLTNIYRKQIDLETVIQQLSKEVEDLKSLEMAQEERIQKIEKRVNEAHLRLSKLSNDLEEGRYANPSTSSSKTPSSSPETHSSPETPDGLYSAAESLYYRGQFEDAILAFQKFIDMHPRDKRVPDAYLKQGLSLIKIGRKGQAKFFFKTLIDKFPKSQEAKIAREELKKIGKKD